MRVAVVVPTYNEVDNIVTLCERIRPSFPDAEIVIVDDASPDGTADAAREAGRASSASSSWSTGRARAGSVLRTAPGSPTAIDARRRVCVQIDADLSHDPARAAGADRQRRARGRPGDRESVRAGRAHRELAVAPTVAVALGQPLRRRRARARRQRCDRRVPGVLAPAPCSGWTSTTVRADGLRLPDRDDPPPGARRRADRRVPDHVPRPASPASRRCPTASSARRSCSCCGSGSPTAAAAANAAASVADSVDRDGRRPV